MTHSPIGYPDRIRLARTPTPLWPLKRISQRLGVKIYIKRDDLTGVELSGNKIRKLEFVLADAKAHKADIVLTCGGAQSNHCRATAVAAALLGLDCRLLLRTSDPAHPPPAEGNILLDRLVGAEIIWITPDEYRAVSDRFTREAEALEAKGRIPYIIPEGASNAMGAWGYIKGAEELFNDLAALPGGLQKPTTIVCATGSGGTAAGLILGNRLLGDFARVACVNVCDDEAYFVEKIGTICETAVSDFGLPVSFDRSRDIRIFDGYVGEGYALSRPAELAMIRDLAREEAIVLDPVYTGKAFFGMLAELKKDPAIFGERIVFMHTGGIFGLFPKADQLQALL